MNERIRKLAGECFVITDDGRFDYANEYMVQRFAELIVRECADVANQHMEHNEGTDYNVGGKIKQHFGVES